MKKQYLYLELALISIFFVLPPLLNFKAEAESTISANLSPFMIVQVCLSLALEYQYLTTGFTEKYTPLKLQDKEAEDEKIPFWKQILYFCITLAVLFLINGFMSLLHKIFPSLDYFNASKLKFDFSVKNTISIIAVFIAGAFYEEAIYRLFLPEAAKHLLKKNKITLILTEILIILVFGASHLYLGMLSVINAVLCGTVLRFTAIKTRNIYAGAGAHFTYNLISFIWAVI